MKIEICQLLEILLYGLMYHFIVSGIIIIGNVVNQWSGLLYDNIGFWHQRNLFCQVFRIFLFFNYFFPDKKMSISI